MVSPMINLYASIDSYTTIDDRNGIFGIVINGAVEMAIPNARYPSGICRQSSLGEKLKQNMTQDGQQDLTKANHLQRGRVRTKTVKKASKVLIEKYYPRLTLDFQTNKKIASEVAIIPSKRLRNKIAGFTTHLMKRIQRGPVRGISFKLQEEERERKDNYIPEVSALDISAIEIDTETQNLLKSLNFEELSGVTAVEVKQAVVETRRPRKERA
ncbi:40S ribosomal protein S17 [Podila verticillata]|nr:40S ribosomal protein S17 [Podila verticillata]